MKVIKLYPAFPFRFRVGMGKMDVTDDLIHSDTLFSAIINCADKLYSQEEIVSLITQFVESKINISSVFYGIKTNDKDIFFLPKPFGRLTNAESEDIVSKKRIKKLRYLSLDIWKELVTSWDGKSFKYNLLKYKTLNGQFLLSNSDLGIFEEKKTEHISIIRKSIEPKVKVQRDNSSAGDFYFQAEIELVPISGKIEPLLFFLFRGDIDRKLNAIFNLLIEEGIGGERFLGKGSFKKWEVSEVDLPEPDDNTDNLSLSLVLPETNEVNALKSYNILKRDGFIYSSGGTPYRKKAVRLLSEGSIFSRNIRGKLLDVKPEFVKLNHPVYVNGLSFNIKIGV